MMELPNWLTPALLVAIIGLAWRGGGKLIGLYTSQQIKFREFEIRVTNLESQHKDIMLKLESIASVMNEIKVQMRDKADRQ